MEKGIKRLGRKSLRRRILIRLIVAAVNEIMKLICIRKSRTFPFYFGRVNLFYEYESVEELKKEEEIYKMRKMSDKERERERGEGEHFFKRTFQRDIRFRKISNSFLKKFSFRFFFFLF